MRPRAPEALDAGGLAVRLTALALLVDLIPVWYLRALVLLLAGLALLFPPVLRTPAVWLAFAFLTGARVARLWPLVDNHHYLLVYWTLAILIALCLSRPDEALATSARWLIAFVFVWATLWKGFLSPDFLDGRFYRVRLLTDDRFAQKAELLGGLSKEDIARNRAWLALNPGAPEGSADAARPATAIEPPSFRRLVTFLTWSTILFEAALALAFLLPWGRWTAAIRHGLLIAFCVGAYAIAPVVGFGWLLATMGVAQTPVRWRGLRAVYVAVWFLVYLVHDVPWAGLLLRLGA